MTATPPASSQTATHSKLESDQVLEGVHISAFVFASVCVCVFVCLLCLFVCAHVCIFPLSLGPLLCSSTFLLLHVCLCLARVCQSLVCACVCANEYATVCVCSCLPVALCVCFNIFGDGFCLVRVCTLSYDSSRCACVFVVCVCAFVCLCFFL